MKNFLIKTFIFIFALSMCISLPETINAKSEFRGIDISVWQGDIDFREVKRDGISHVYIRAAQGNNYIDPKFERNYKDASEEDIKVGFYHYVTARNEREAREQAYFFYDLIRDKNQDLRPVMDFEELKGLSRREANDIARAYMQTLERLLNYKPAFYSSAYDAREVWERDLRKYPLWVADYGVREPYSIGHWREWSGFQYSSRGRIDGIRGYVDLDRFKEEMLITEEEKSHASSRYETYTVREGDTITEIARKFNTSVEDLIELNKLRLIYPGEVLIIRK